MNSIVTVHDDQYAPQPNSSGCTNCDFYKNKCTYLESDCVGEIYHLIHKEGDIVTINGKQYQAHRCTCGCNGCAFNEGRSAYDCPVYNQVGCFGVIYNLIGFEPTGNLYVDLTWLKGTARVVVSEAIQKKAIDNGWHWLSTSGTLENMKDGWLVLREDKHIEAWCDEHKSAFDSYTNLYELSVNDALDGNYSNTEVERKTMRAGDVVFSKGRFYTVEAVDYHGEMVACRGRWIHAIDYKLCRERKQFKFHAGEKVTNGTIYMFLKYMDNDGNALVFHNDGQAIVPAISLKPMTLKERYEVIKEVEE